MSLSRILKMLAAFFTGQGVSVVAQLLVPPLFINRYADGVEVYGEWIALSAAVTYLGTLNYGIQTYANNQMTILYNGGDVEQAKALQANALRLLLLLVGCLAVCGATVLDMPVGRWLGLTHVGSRAASVTLYLLMLGALSTMLMALVANSYMMVGKMHRGANWLIFQRLAGSFVIAVCLWYRASFVVLALVQLVITLVFTPLVLLDVKKNAPIVMPSLRYGHWNQIGALVRPSAHFGLLALSGFLIWQGPLLIIQKVLGPSSVAIFSLARTVFSMSRQGLAILSFSIGQEITLLIGQRDWPKLKRLYDLSERVVLLLVPVFSAGVLLLSPFLMAVWLHKRDLYQPSLCLVMAIISAVMGIKEHKSQFQASSNQHERLAKFSVGAYTIMLIVAAVLLRPFGVLAFMFAWLAAEIAQTVYILRLNVQLFPAASKISMAPVVRLVAVLTVGFAVAAWPAYASVDWSLATVVVVASAFMVLMAAGSYYAFGLGEVRTMVLSKFRQRFTPRPG